MSIHVKGGVGQLGLYSQMSKIKILTSKPEYFQLLLVCLVMSSPCDRDIPDPCANGSICG